jgi:peptidoglycan/xylan/chitin deacetylase (PgdA/CDA1 family)
MSQAKRGLTVGLSFDFDALSNWISAGQSAAAISRGEFGAFALPRVVRLLAKHEAKATFFVPGHTAVAYPDLVRLIRDEGHEIGSHGWVHESPLELDADAERRVMERALEALDAVAGVRPTGYRAPSAVHSESTIELLLELGYSYDASLSASDFVPYYLRRGDRVSRSEPYEFGTACDLVEIPFNWALDDFPHFEHDAWTPQQSPPSVVREIWQGEFDYALANAPGGIIPFCMHPQIIGRGYRMTFLDELLDYMGSQPGVVFEPLGTYVERWRAANPLTSWAEARPVHAPRG